MAGSLPPPGNQVGFAYHGAGDEFHLYPLELGPSTLTFKVIHFSGYGVGNGTAADRAAQQQRSPTAAEDRANQRASDVVDAARQQARTLTADDLTTLEDIYREWLTNSLQPDLNNAQSAAQSGVPGFDQLLDAAIAEFISLADGIARNGISFSELAAMRDLLSRAIKFGIEKAFERCVSNHDPSQAVNMLRWFKQAALLGLDGGISPLGALVRKCANFELRFASQMKTTLPADAATFISFVHAEVPLTASATSGNVFTGSAALNYDSFSATFRSVEPRCSITTSTKGSTFSVISLELPLNPSKSAIQLVAVMDPGDPSGSVTFRCPKGVTITAPGVKTGGPGFIDWIVQFSCAHQDEQEAATNRGKVVGWTIFGPGTEVFAEKVYVRSLDTVCTIPVSENTTLELIHKPLP